MLVSPDCPHVAGAGSCLLSASDQCSGAASSQPGLVLHTRDETHHPPLLTRLGSTGLVKKANVVGENELVNEYLLCKLCREYIIFHDKTQ